MTRYRKKPAEVEAWQVGSDDPRPEWLEARRLPSGEWRAMADGSVMQCQDGDYITREPYMTRAMSRIEFEQTYEAIG